MAMNTAGVSEKEANLQIRIIEPMIKGVIVGAGI